MASANCWRCLARPSQRITLPTSLLATSSPAAPTAAFTTSATQYTKAMRPAPKSKAKVVGDGGMSRHIRAGKMLILNSKKKRSPDKFKPPASGERKAFRKRIQLTNDNALEVKGLPELTAENIIDSESVGKVIGFPGELIDQLRASEAFKATQNWSLFRSPHLLVRQETVDLAKQLTEAASKKETLRLVLNGERAAGKSILGLQAQAAAFLNKWIVINIPEGQDLVTAATEYAHIPNSEMYSQPTYTIKLFQAISKANHAVLSQLKVELDHLHLPISVNRGTSLAALATATKEPEFAWPVFQSFWRELMQPGRPPILFTLDGLSHIMRVSDYRTPSFDLIHSHDFGLIRLFTDALGGKSKFPNGGAVLGVCTKGNTPILPSFEKALEQAIAARDGQPLPPRDPFYRKYDERVFEAMNGVQVLGVRGVSKAEARALMEYWAASGILRMRVDEKSVSEKWTLAGSGILGEMERVALYDVRMSM
ncbi:mitochondrial ribosomal protein [Annulohypoxylon maeteangense]|uniref:mitochondrial ribosomal protein n=1 Tax=Annulohypoxylon maeteangense TaxID=1927788 RepID=UPI0020081345|nr:mitochondrial ribosomal protein [Annulohypoxylon maeteangense]KAI0890165.1 mitochondrial ribosomal protein [Annulohypoxylon maeteangense]